MTSNGRTAAPVPNQTYLSSSSGNGAIRPNGIENPTRSIRYPLPKNEPNIFVKLDGNNEVPYMELWGWTHAIPVAFPMLKSDLVMKKVTIPEGQPLPERLEFLNEMSRTLQSYANSASLGYERIICPIFVQVIAKKKVDIIAIKDKKKDKSPCRVLAIGNLIVADASGACILTLFNESVAIIHEGVSVGDYLIINRGSFQAPPVDRENLVNPFHKELLKLEIKIDKYQVRHILHVPFVTHSKLKLPSIGLFNAKDKLWFPSDVLNDPAFKVVYLKNQQPILEHWEDNFKNRCQRKQKYFDICGYVSYVGMVERSAVYEEYLICYEKITETEGEEMIWSPSFQSPIKQFKAFRWVQLVDKCSSEPLLVKIYFNNGIKLQEKLVPGALVVLTHCQMPFFSFMEDFVNTTIFTSIYTSEELPSLYFKLVPSSYLSCAANHISESACKQLFERADIVWSVGGTIRPNIKSPDQFLEHFHRMEIRNLEKDRKFVPNGLKFDRRESFIIYFRGKIEGVQEISVRQRLDGESYEEIRQFVFGSENSIRLRVDNWPVYRDSYSENSRGDGNWFYHQRKLPPFKLPVSGSSTRTMVDEVTKFYEKFCSPLLLPCVYPIVLDNEPTPLRTCQKLSEPQFYRVIIKDEGSEKWYDALWKNFPAETMQKKLTAANGKVIVGLIDVHYLERGWGYVVALRDFVIE